MHILWGRSIISRILLKYNLLFYLIFFLGRLMSFFATAINRYDNNYHQNGTDSCTNNYRCVPWLILIVNMLHWVSLQIIRNIISRWIIGCVAGRITRCCIRRSRVAGRIAKCSICRSRVICRISGGIRCYVSFSWAICWVAACSIVGCVCCCTVGSLIYIAVWITNSIIILIQTYAL